MKKFANQNNCRTFVSGMRKQGSLDGIILLVISFSVINYVVSRAFACDRPTLFSLGAQAHLKKSCPPALRAAPQGAEVHPKSWTVNNVFICNEFDTVSDSFRLTVI